MQYADKKLRGRICSPVCLSMVLNYYGKKVSLENTLKGVYDEESGVYGTWPLNTAFAAQQGLGAAVDYGHCKYIVLLLGCAGYQRKNAKNTKKRKYLFHLFTYGVSQAFFIFYPG